METPLPNFYFMGVQFIHLLALSIWVGGILIIQAVIFPSFSSTKTSQKISSKLRTEILKRFHQLTLFCAPVLVLTSVIKFWAWENLTPWNLIRYIAISVMAAMSLYAFFKLLPQLNQLPPEQGAEPAQVTDPDLTPFYQLSTRLMLITLSCGLTALLMA